MRDRLINVLVWLGIFCSGAGISSIVVATRVHGHDPYTHQANSLSDARSPKGGLCCDGKDYNVPQDWKQKDEGGYKVLIGKQWLDVPPEAEVTNMKNPDMEAKVWLYYINGEQTVRCFLPGGLT